MKKSGMGRAARTVCKKNRTIQEDQESSSPRQRCDETKVSGKLHGEEEGNLCNDTRILEVALKKMVTGVHFRLYK